MNRPLLTSLEDLGDHVCLPGYSPEDHGVGMVHLGVGAFHRAHQAVMTDDALAHQGGDWRIAGVSLRSQSIAKNLNAQNGLYTVIERSATATTARVVAAIDHVVAADSRATLDLLCEPAIRIVTLTVTEAGYGIDRESRLPDTGNATVAADLATPANPSGVLGLLVAAIAYRRTENLLPFTVLSCDNLPENGKLLRDGVIGFARSSHDDELASWIAENIAFPCSMVDRITPAPTEQTRTEAALLSGCDDAACVETESFTQWIIEDNFPSGRPRWEAGGALFVDDVTPYERMKLTMLNGSHSMLAYAGFLTGKCYVRDVMEDENLSSLVQRHLTTAAGLLEPLSSVEFNDYAAALADRFSNPSIAHETFQIATDGTQKMPQRIFQPAIAALDAQRDLQPFVFATAMWMRFCLQRHDDGTRYELNDSRSDEIVASIGKKGDSADCLSDAFHAMPQLIPQHLAANEFWRSGIEEVLSRVLISGCSMTIRQEAESVDRN